MFVWEAGQLASPRKDFKWDELQSQVLAVPHLPPVGAPDAHGVGWFCKSRKAFGSVLQPETWH